MQGIKELHIKDPQSNDLPEIGNYLQEILDKVLQFLLLKTRNQKENFGKISENPTSSR